MDEQILQQIFDELFESLEPLDTQTAALLQFLKSKGIVTDEELAPFLKQAGDASSVRWLGARIRAEALISSALRPPDITAAQPADAGHADADSANEATKNEVTNKEKAEEGHQPQSQTEASRKEAAEKNSTEAETEQDDSDLNSDLSDPPLFPAGKNKNKDKNEAA
jgi:hypothetical protein